MLHDPEICPLALFQGVSMSLSLAVLRALIVSLKQIDDDCSALSHSSIFGGCGHFILFENLCILTMTNIILHQNENLDIKSIKT